MQYNLIVSACLLASLFLFGSVQAGAPIWISPTNVNYTYPSDYFERYAAGKGVWATIDVGAGSRGAAPSVLMDTKGILWILFGAQRRDGSTAYDLFNVWNYNPKTDQYRYVWGSSATGATGVNPRNPGDLRVPSVTNHPGNIRNGGATIDNNDNIWLTTWRVNGELWMFNTSSWVFTRMFGLDGVNDVPSLGANPGQPGEDVWPGKVQGPCLLSDSQNNLWMLGGAGSDGPPNNAVWHFNTTSYLWTYIYGSVTAQSITHNATFYGGVWLGGCFMDDNDRVWLFGGYGQSAKSSGSYASIWTFDTRSKRQYELEYGPNTLDITPQVVSEDFHADNHPGGCQGSLLVDRKDGTLLVVAGYGKNAIGYWGGTDLVWLYSKPLKQWRLHSGNLSASESPGSFTHYREPGSEFPGTAFFGRSDGKNMNGDVYIVGGGNNLYYELSRKDIWFISMDQCSSSTSNNCDPNANCIEEMFGYSCACKEGYSGDGYTCTAGPSVISPSPSTSPVGSIPSGSPPSGSTPSWYTPSGSTPLSNPIAPIMSPAVLAPVALITSPGVEKTSIASLMTWSLVVFVVLACLI